MNEDELNFDLSELFEEIDPIIEEMHNKYKEFDSSRRKGDHQQYWDFCFKMPKEELYKHYYESRKEL